MEPLRGMTSTEGDLRTTPFAHVLVELLEQRETGTLFVYGPARRVDAVIRIENGFAVRGRLEGSAEPNLMQLLIPLCARSDGSFGFQPGVDALGPVPHVATGTVDLLELITAASRGPMREDTLADVMAVVSRNLLRLHPRGDFARYGFTAQERSVLEGLSHGPVDLGQLRMMSSAPEHVLRRVLYVLRITHALTLLPIARAHSGTISHAPPLPPRPASAPAMSAIPAQLDRLSIPAPPSRVPGAVSRPISRAVTSPVTPPPRPSSSDRIPAVPRGDDTARVGSLDAPFADEHTPAIVMEPHIKQASQRSVAPPPLPRRVKTTPGSRYSMQTPDHGTTAPFESRAARARRALGRPDSASTRERLERTAETQADADASATRAEQLLKQGDVLSALRSAEEALRFGSVKSEHEALYAWILYVQTGGGDRVHPRAWEHIEHALRRDPLCARAHHYKALMLKRMGRIDEANWHLRRATQIDPKLIDAARELRLQDMRKRQHASESRGVMQRLFKRLNGE